MSARPHSARPLSADELRALAVLIETASVTAAARRLGVSQPAMSRTLARLRAVAGDALLVPAGGRLVPTPTARAMLPRVERALLALRAVLEPDAAVAVSSPAPPPRGWTLAASDYGFHVVLRDLVLAERAREPRRELRVVPLGLETIGALARGDLDAALMPKVEVDGLDDFVFRPLLRDAYVVALRRGHAALARPLTVERYLALEHVAVQTGLPGRSAVHDTLVRRGHRRRVAVRAPSITAALELVAASDLVATLPSRVVAAHPRALATRRPPVAVDELVLHLVFAPARAADPDHRAMRERLLAHAAAMPPPPAPVPERGGAR